MNEREESRSGPGLGARGKSSVIHVVEDDPHDRSALEVHLRREGYTIQSFSMGEEFLHAPDEVPDLVLLDVVLPGIGGIEVLSRFAQRHPEVPVILLTGHGSVEVAFQGMRLGAYDFIPKPFEMARLSVSIHNALRMKDLTGEVRKLQGELRVQFDFRNLLGTSPSITRVFADLEHLAGSDLPVLIQGENGTGKELVARTIHYNSRRGEGPFMHVNCDTTSQEHLDTELFGPPAGPGGRRGNGKWARAAGGTLYLDEVADLPASLQAELVRRLEARTRPQAEGEPPLPDVRLICSSRKDIVEEIHRGVFDSRLLDFLATFRIKLPPLRERHGDITLLARRFLAEAAEAEKRPAPQFSEGALHTLEVYPWPGNVRELKNVTRQLLVLTHTDVIREEDLPPSLRQAAHAAEQAQEEAGEGSPLLPLKEVEEQLIRRTLAQTGGDVTRSASLLGISRATLYRRLKTLHISRNNP